MKSMEQLKKIVKKTMECLDALQSRKVKDKQKDLGNNRKVAIHMFLTLSKLVVLIAIFSTRKWFSYTSARPISCKTYKLYHEIYNETKHNLVIVNVFRSTMNRSIPEEDLSFANQIEKEHSLQQINLNYLIYYYPREKCQEDVMDLFLDLLLNKTLIDSRLYKIIAVFTDVNETELTNIANLMSPYSLPIFTMFPLKSSYITHNQLIYKHYDNVVMFLSSPNWAGVQFLMELTKGLDVRLMTILYDAGEFDKTAEIDFISKQLMQRKVCINTYKITRRRYSENFDTKFEMDIANVYVLILDNYIFSVKVIEYFNKHALKNTVIVVYSHNWSIDKKLENALFNINLKKLQIFVLKYYASFRKEGFLGSYFYYRMNQMLWLNIARFESFIVKIIEQDPKVRTFAIKQQDFFKDFNSKYEFGNMFLSDFSMLTIVEGYLLAANDGLQNYTKIYSNKYIIGNRLHWTCWKCEDSLKLQPVCRTRNCSAGYFPVHLSRGCCWNCKRCYPGYVKPNKGQISCFKCPNNSIANRNHTKCLPIVYKYYRINFLRQIVTYVLSSLGLVYTTFFLVVFLYHKNTPIVKSSNFMLSVLQITLHATFNIHLAITIFEQHQYICYVQSILGGYLLKIILSIYIIKTNQLLTIFQSNEKIKRNAFLTLKEAAFPVAYIASNMLITFIFLVVYKKFEYGVLEIKNSTVKYNFCNAGFYFYIDVASVIILSIVCSVQAFMARKLPANYNETNYIFLAMFATTNLLLLSIPLDASFNVDGQKLFVNSSLMYAANITLLSIAYGYKINIILFEKERNTKEAFQRNMQEAMKQHFEKLRNKLGK